VHYGATTQDIMDTALALQLGDSCMRLEALLVGFGDALAALVDRHASTVMAGRTHAQHAVPTTFGAKIAVFLEEVRQELVRVRAAGAQVRVVSLFGAGGTNAAMGERAPAVRTDLARRLDLADSAVPWHVARGNVAHYALTAAGIAALCTRFAREVVDLSRSEIGEVREPGGLHRGASSTMPQKTNPIWCESVIGFAVNASTLAPALLRAREAGHERAAGEWQIEWYALPLVSVLTASALALSTQIAQSLRVFPDAMRRNLDIESGRLMSEAVMMTLAPRTGRERAHDLVYAAAERGRVHGETLTAALRETLPADLFEAVGSVEPGGYIGEAEHICRAAISAWESCRTASPEGKERP
jgi:3-carboxy-cis,cis-muconate cycloisomerase